MGKQEETCGGLSRLPIAKSRIALDPTLEGGVDPQESPLNSRMSLRYPLSENPITATGQIAGAFINYIRSRL